MLDTIDLKEQKERGDAYIQAGKKRHFRKWLVIITIIAVAVLFQFLSKKGDVGQIYRYQNGELVALAPNMTGAIETAPDGSLWAIDVVFSQLYHYDGSNWQAVEENGIGKVGLEEIAFYNNEVWILTNADIQVYDGTNWRKYDGGVPSSNIKGFEVGRFGTAVLDDLGNLAILQNGEWTHPNVNDFLGFATYNDYSYLSMISDGKRLWVSGNGMAVYDGESWEEVSNYGGYTVIVGQDESHIWLNVGIDFLATVHKGSGELQVYSEEVTGISEDAWIWGMQALGERWVFATDMGFFEYDGKHWQEGYSLPIKPNMEIWDFVLDSDGSLIVSLVFNESFDYLRSVFSVYFLQLCSLILPVGVVIPMYFYANKATKASKARIELSRKRLPSLLPDMPEIPIPSAQPQSKWASLVTVLGYAVIAVLSFFAAERVNIWLGLVTWIGLVMLWSLRHILFQAKADRQTRIKTLKTVGTGLVFVIIILAGLVAFGFAVFPYIWRLHPYISMPISILLCTAIVLYWFKWGLMLTVILPYRYVTQAASRGDFETALKRNVGFRRLAPTDINYQFQRGFVLLEAGRWEEAETVWREVVVAAQNNDPAFLAPCLINLASTMQALGKSDEAFPFFEAAVKICPEGAAGYRELALWYMDNNLYPERALGLTDLVMHFDKKPRFDLTFSRYMWAINLGTRALALAKNGRKEEAISKLEQAFRENEPNSLVAKAVVLLLAGDVYRSLGEAEKAKMYYQDTMALHPSSSSHRAAAKALQELDAALT